MVYGASHRAGQLGEPGPPRPISKLTLSEPRVLIGRDKEEVLNEYNECIDECLPCVGFHVRHDVLATAEGTVPFVPKMAQHVLLLGF